MSFGIKILLILSLMVLCAAMPHSSDQLIQKIWLTHCDGGYWWVQTEDADSVTVACDVKEEE